jgi:hypothetical protein
MVFRSPAQIQLARIPTSFFQNCDACNDRDCTNKYQNGPEQVKEGYRFCAIVGQHKQPVTNDYADGSQNKANDRFTYPRFSSHAS